MRILSWNLFHGRAVPGAGRDLHTEFEAALAGWDWDVALLQEVPPWWPACLARACDADHHSVLTSRNSLLPIRRRLATRFPDLMKSGGGGANAILVRGDEIRDQRSVVLRRRPERRVAHAVELAGAGWIANLHAQAHSTGLAQADLHKALAALEGWAGAGARIVLGGDLNIRKPVAGNLTLVGTRDVDAIFVRGWSAAAEPQVLERGPLSDHPPLLVTLREG